MTPLVGVLGMLCLHFFGENQPTNSYSFLHILRDRRKYLITEKITHITFGITLRVHLVLLGIDVIAHLTWYLFFVFMSRKSWTWQLLLYLIFFSKVEEKTVSPKKHAADRQIQSIAEFFQA